MEQFHDLIGRHGDDITALQMSVRAIVIFLFGLVLVRFAGKRVFGRWGALDIILSVIIGSNLSRTITGGAPFLPTVCACLVLVGLHWSLAYAAVLFRPLGDLVKGRPAQLIRDGVVDPAAMRRNGVGEQDLEQALRCAGVTEPTSVRAAYLERSGEISVLK